VTLAAEKKAVTAFQAEHDPLLRGTLVADGAPAASYSFDGLVLDVPAKINASRSVPGCKFRQSFIQQGRDSSQTSSFRAAVKEGLR